MQAARWHWWTTGMQEITEALLGGPTSGLDVLDAGCGSGTNLGLLERFAAPRPVQACDIASAGLEVCRRMNAMVDLVSASVTHLPYASSSFDLVGCMDVLQHLRADDEALAVGELLRVTRPGGRVVVRTNARFGRAGVEDRDDWRLYTPDRLRDVLEAAGLRVEALTPVNCLQGLWASLPRVRRGRPETHHDHGHGHDHEAGDHESEADREGAERTEWGQAGLGIPRPAHPAKNAVLLALLRGEARWVAGGRRSLPFGHSLIAVAVRPA